MLVQAFNKHPDYDRLRNAHRRQSNQAPVRGVWLALLLNPVEEISTRELRTFSSFRAVLYGRIFERPYLRM